MFGRVTARSLALFLMVLASTFVGQAPALAQYQIDAVSRDAAATPQIVLPEPFGLDTSPVLSGGILAKWSDLTAAIRDESDILTRCRNDATSCPGAAQKFLAVVADGRKRDGRARFGVINRAINLAIQPMSDLAQWGVPDRWSAPLVTLASGRGDCEDYAIAKYVALKEAGVSEDDLRLVIVRDLASGEDHAVVAARWNGTWIVLDNRRLAMIEDTDMPRVLPLFALSRDGVKAFVPAVTVEARAPIQAAESQGAPSSLGL